MSGADDRADTPVCESAFERLLRLAARDSRARALVAVVIERSGLGAEERSAILREFLARDRGPGEE